MNAASVATNAASSVMSLLKEFPHLISMHGRNFAHPAENFAFEGLEGGLPKGALVEVSGSAGSGKTETVLRFLAQNPEVRVAWVEDEFTVYPCAFPQNRVGLERVLFVDSPSSELFWTIHQMLRSGVFGVIVLRMASGLGERSADGASVVLRRLQLAAEKSGVTVILLTERPARRGTWPISVQLQASRSVEGRSILLNVLKFKGQKSWQLAIE